ncbi:hypothetical protein [Streptomyces sp. NPDC005890]
MLLHRAPTGAMNGGPDIVCTVHSDSVDDDQDDDPEGHADLEAQFADAVA